MISFFGTHSIFPSAIAQVNSPPHTHIHFTTNTLIKPKFMKKFQFLRPRLCCRVKTPPPPRNTGASPELYPGVRRAGVLLCPVRRPPCASVKVHVVGGGFQSMRLGAVVDRGRVRDNLLQVRVVVAVGMLQVHSVRIVVPPARLLCIIHRLQGKETGRLR